jgi:hypothetical protein
MYIHPMNPNVRYRLLPLAGLTPTATLSVVASLHMETKDQLIPTLDFSSTSWQNMSPENMSYIQYQASLISEDMVLPQLTTPATNSSYTLQFYGPTIQCEEASTLEDQAVFNQYSMALWNESEIFTSSTFQMFNDGEPRFLNVSDLTSDFSKESYSFLIASVFDTSTVQNQNSVYDTVSWRFLVQTANSSIVCSNANASFELGIDYVNGVQSISQGKIEIVTIASYSMDEADVVDGYTLMFLFAAGVLWGNVSAGAAGAAEGDNSHFGDTGLIDCDEIYWWLNPDNYNDTIFTQYPHLAWPQDFTLPAEYSLCRNRSLSLAIQDLANNLTISLLSNPNMTVNVSTPVTITTPQNIYRYDSRNLIISYTIGIVATIFAVIVGVMSIYSNGVCHSTSFSAIMTSTSVNHQISELSRGQPLGVKPLSRTVAEKKLRLGVIARTDDEAEKDEWGDPVNICGFGLEGTVTKLRKGKKCS